VPEPSPAGPRNRRAVPLILLAASFMCILVSTRSVAGLPQYLGTTIFGFFQRGFALVGGFVSDTVSSIAELRQLRENYRELSAKLERFTNIERGNAELREENKRLKEQLGFSDRIPYQRIAARIIAKDPGNLYSTITIDKGIGDGIRKNMPIVAFQDGIEGLVGRVVDVGHGISKIVPLFDSSLYVAGRLANQYRHEGLVGGQGSADAPLVMRFVKKRAKEETQFGDLVVTSGYDSVYPPEIAIGRVAKVRVLEYQTSAELDIDPVLDFSRIEYVFALRMNDAMNDPDGSGGGG
jgi:rod shape-determining protein MreC